ncbi:ATP-binding protein [uncultured Holdemanella sp.]|uniref:ATP-binding protein n=1 Tax=uncultured Holdemanella sp. TaxID=1763549 RepID=UPI0025F4A717|nr:ATP-binding protein [uncultured Holdemanella sp.]
MVIRKFVIKGIANIFSQMGLVEAWESGIKRILNAAEEYGLPKPRFQEFDNMFCVELLVLRQEKGLIK